jgi:UDPglucose 6-dehydrogenase
VAYDPGIEPGQTAIDSSLLTVVDDPHLAAKDAEAVVILTEWPEFRALDWMQIARNLRKPIVIDARNLLDPDVIRCAGLMWAGVGRHDGGTHREQ